LEIVEYLDDTYSETVRLILPGTKALQNVYAESIWAVYAKDINPVAGMFLPNQWFTDRNKEYYLKWAPPKTVLSEKDVKKAWETFHSRLGDLDRMIGSDNPFVMGKVPSFADCAMIAWLMLLRFVWDDETEEWKNIMDWHRGRWRRLLDTYENLRRTGS